MDLSLATIDQIDEELTRREIPFSLIVSAMGADETHSEEDKCQLHSSLPNPVQQASHFLLGALSILATMAAVLEEKSEDHAEEFKRWQDVGETLLSDMLKTAGEWEEEDS